MSAYTDDDDLDEDAKDAELSRLRAELEMERANTEAAQNVMELALKRAKDAEADNARLREQVGEARRVLLSIEYGASDDWGEYCPDCGWYLADKAKKHHEDCALDAWLADLPRHTRKNSRHP